MNPTFILGGIIAFLLSAIGGYFYGHSVGVDAERAEWQGKELKATQDVIDARDKALAEKAALEKTYQAAAVAASQTYQEGLKNERDKKDRIISDLRAGNVRLRDPGTKYTLGQNPMPGNDTAASRCDAGAGTELSGETSEFLVSEASRADQIVRQLTACQAQLNAAYRLHGSD